MQLKSIHPFDGDVSTSIDGGSLYRPLNLNFPSDACSVRAVKGLQPESVLPDCDVAPTLASQGRRHQGTLEKAAVLDDL
jgi:hypothetical protein